MRKIAIVGFKGGIGKTTTCVSLGAGLALRGHQVLLVDTDTQANLSVALGIEGQKKSLTDVLCHRASPAECIVPARKNLFLLPSNLSLFKAQQRMILEMAYEQIFVDLFQDLDSYDYQLFDCAPSASLLTINAVAYVNEVFIPVSMEMLALSGLRQFLTYLHMIHRILDKGPTVRLIIPTFYDPRRRVSEEVMQVLAKDFGSRVTHPIRIDTKLSEAPGMGKTIYEYARRSRGAADYAKLVERVARMSLPAAG